MAVDWILEQIDTWNAEGVDLRSRTFLLHAFIPAKASAWAYAQHASDIVHIDALWGLADGLQYLPCDSYFFDASRQRELSATIRYKAKALFELPSGEWKYEDIKAKSARHRVLSNLLVKQIATGTKAVAQALQTDVQVMWFVDIPELLNLGRAIPWYLDTEYLPSVQERADRSLLPVTVRNPSDLQSLTAHNTAFYKVFLDPEAKFIRDESFLDAVAETCLRINLPVELQGSVLAHAYHQLRRRGVQPSLFPVAPLQQQKNRRLSAVRPIESFGNRVVVPFEALLREPLSLVFNFEKGKVRIEMVVQMVAGRLQLQCVGFEWLDDEPQLFS